MKTNRVMQGLAFIVLIVVCVAACAPAPTLMPAGGHFSNVIKANSDLSSAGALVCQYQTMYSRAGNNQVAKDQWTIALVQAQKDYLKAAGDYNVAVSQAAAGSYKADWEKYQKDNNLPDKAYDLDTWAAKVCNR